MAGVEQATAPSAAAPDETPQPAATPDSDGADQATGDTPATPTSPTGGRAGRRAARRRASQESGRLSDAADPANDATQHAGTDDTKAGQHAGQHADAGPAKGGQHADTGPAKAGQHADTDDTKAGQHAAPDAKPAQHAADDNVSEPPRVSLIKAARRSRADTTPGQALVPARPAHAGAPAYRPRHARRNRRRWPAFVAAGLVLVALAGVGAAALVNRQNDEADRVTAPAATNIAPAPANLPTAASAGPAATASATPGGVAAPGTAQCRFSPAPDKNPQIVPPTAATRSGLVTATIGTNRGPITLELDATNAPCTVESFLTLAAGRYFNDTACHRLTTLLIFVLQCGDPTALGSGDPGYSFDDENLPAPGGTPYPRGTLAMANAGPDTNGSQFFVVYKDSPIDPNYPVFGKVTGGLEIVDRVAAGGAPGNDGQPNEPLVIQTVQVT